MVLSLHESVQSIESIGISDEMSYRTEAGSGAVRREGAIFAKLSYHKRVRIFIR